MWWLHFLCTAFCMFSCLTDNYTFVTLVIILKLNAVQMLSLNPFMHFQEERFVNYWTPFLGQMNFSKIKARFTIIQVVLRVFQYSHLNKEEFEDSKGIPVTVYLCHKWPWIASGSRTYNKSSHFLMANPKKITKLKSSRLP